MNGDRPISHVLQDLLGNVQQLVHGEIQLVRAEVRDDAKRALSAGAWLGLAAVNGVLAWSLLVWAAAFALTAVMPLWGATLVVAGITGAIAATLFVLGRQRLQHMQPGPERAVESMKENLEWIKQSTR